MEVIELDKLRDWSKKESQNSDDEVTQNVQVIAKNSILAFKETNRGTAPARIIVYKDSIAGDEAFLRAFEDLL